MSSPDSPLSSQQLQQIEIAFAVERQILTLELSRAIEDKEQIAAGLLLCLSFLIGQTIANIKIEKIDRITPAGRNQGLIDFSVVCSYADRQVNLGICILPFAEIDLVKEACTRLLVYKDFGLDRLCLLRQSDLMTNVYQLPTCLPKLLSKDIGGHFVPLNPHDVVPLLATLSVFRSKQQHELSAKTIFDYLTQTRLLIDNKLIKNILAIAGA
jgi:hypothetical protein